MTRGISPVLAAQVNCRVIFGQPLTRAAPTDGALEALHVALPVLAGTTDEILLGGTEPPRRADSFTLFGAGSILAGFAVAPPTLELEAAAAHLYDCLFATTRDLHLYRIWNYVPRINAVEHGLENYRRFCRGRSLAFERRFGSGFRKLLPAASAVGSVAGPLALGFLAGESPPLHFENPRQVPAFEYPPQYGPRPPSFARATAITTESGRQVIISGTAAISGHATVAAGDLDRQLDCTLENLALIGATAGAGDFLGAPAGWTRRFKVYVRHAADLGRITTRLKTGLLRGGGTVQYLQADLCRTDLLVEIEAVLTATD
jgi:enamine deaminase RidA (YjgF/YER057c/UK114 family)